MFQKLFSTIGKQSQRSAKAARTRRLSFEALERREVLSAAGFQMSAPAEALISQDAKALHLSSAQVQQLLTDDAIAKELGKSINPTALAKSNSFTPAEKLELLAIDHALTYVPAGSRPQPNDIYESAQSLINPNLKYLSPPQIDALPALYSVPSSM